MPTPVAPWIRCCSGPWIVVKRSERISNDQHGSTDYWLDSAKLSAKPDSNDDVPFPMLSLRECQHLPPQHPEERLSTKLAQGHRVGDFQCQAFSGVIFKCDSIWFDCVSHPLATFAAVISIFESLNCFVAECLELWFPYASDSPRPDHLEPILLYLIILYLCRSISIIFHHHIRLRVACSVSELHTLANVACECNWAWRGCERIMQNTCWNLMKFAEPLLSALICSMPLHQPSHVFQFCGLEFPVDLSWHFAWPAGAANKKCKNCALPCRSMSESPSSQWRFCDLKHWSFVLVLVDMEISKRYLESLPLLKRNTCRMEMHADANVCVRVVWEQTSKAPWSLRLQVNAPDSSAHQASCISKKIEKEWNVQNNASWKVLTAS